MKKTFENKPLLITFVLLFLLKLILTVIISAGSGRVSLVFSSFPLCTTFAIITMLFGNPGWPVALLACILVVLIFSIPVFLLFLVINKRGAKMASTILIGYNSLDALYCLPMLFSAPLLTIGFVYNLVLIFLLILLRRSRSGAPTVTNIDPTQT